PSRSVPIRRAKETLLRSQARALAAPIPITRAFSLIMSALLVAAFFASALALNGGPLHASAQSTPASSGASPADAVPSDSVLYMDVQLDQSSSQWMQTY